MEDPRKGTVTFEWNRDDTQQDVSSEEHIRDVERGTARVEGSTRPAGKGGENRGPFSTAGGLLIVGAVGLAVLLLIWFVLSVIAQLVGGFLDGLGVSGSLAAGLGSVAAVGLAYLLFGRK